MLSFRPEKCKDYGACCISRFDTVLIYNRKKQLKRAAEKETQSIVTHTQEFNQELSVYIVDKEIEMNVYIHLRTIQ